MAYTHLKIEYYNNQYDGIRIIENLFSPIRVYVIPQHLVQEARSNLQIKPGIYFLIQSDITNQTKQIFVGECQDWVHALNNTQNAKISWGTAVIIETDSRIFTIDLIDQLQNYIIQKNSDIKDINICNNSIVHTNLIDNTKLALIESIYESIKFIMATQGYHLENRKNIIKQHSDLGTCQEIQSTKSLNRNSQIFPHLNSTQIEIDKLPYVGKKNNGDNLPVFGMHIARENITAKAVYLNPEMLVFKGSQISSRQKSSANKKREKILGKWIEQGDIVRINGKLTLQKDKRFPSPSAAASFIVRCSSRGPLVWKDDRGKTLGEYFDSNENTRICSYSSESINIQTRPIYPKVDPIIFTFYTKNKTTKAVMTWNGNNEYIVKRQSEIARHGAYNKDKLEKIKNANIEYSNSKYILKEDKSFTSASSAASFVLGRSANGNIEWIDKEGRQFGIVRITKSDNLISDNKANWMSLDKELLLKLVAKAKEQGFMTYDELNNVLPVDVLTGDKVDEVYDALNAMGIEIISADEVPEELRQPDKKIYISGDIIKLFFEHCLPIDGEIEGEYNTKTKMLTIFKGSPINFLNSFDNTNSSLYRRHQKDLKNGIILCNKDEYKLNTDKEFLSPQEATSYILGNWIDHIDAWSDDQGTPLNEIIHSIEKSTPKI